MLLYLPLAFSIVLIHWYGWRILPILYINAIATLILWNAPGSWFRILLLGTHEPVVAATSKLVVDFVNRGRKVSFFSDTKTLVGFVVYGVMLPCLVNSVYVYNYTFVNGNLETVILFWLADFLTILAIAVPVLHFFKPSSTIISIYKSRAVTNRNTLLLFFAILVVSILLSFRIPFDRYWFIYGIGALIIAIRLGFEWAIAINLSVFILNYILPLIDVLSSIILQGSSQLTNVHLGSAMMMFTALLVGRVVSDLRSSEQNLVIQKAEIEKANRQLKQANEELDRFVYSVSHDLSAPLKSIKGLVGVSKLENTSGHGEYLDMIEKSVVRLEDFISEVLDYSRTSRKETVREDVNLAELFDEVVSKFTFLDNFERVTFKTDFAVAQVKSDRFLLRVILGNLISNSIKYQRVFEGHQPLIQIRTTNQNERVVLEVSDNGEGIRADRQNHVFKMFYRGTANSSGSGLGLYIAREAATKLGGDITFESKFGEGSKFMVLLPNGHAE